MNGLVNQTLHTASYQPNGVEIPLSINEQEKRERYVHEVVNDVNALVNTQVFKDQAYERLGITDRSAPVRVQIKVTDHQLYVRKPGQSEWTEVPIDSIARGINQEVLAKGAAIWAETVPESCGMPPPLSTRQTVPIEASQEITRLEEALRSAQAQLEVGRRAYEELRHSFGTQGEQLTSRQEELEELRLQNGQLATELEAAHRESDERQAIIDHLEQALQGATGRNATLQNQLQEVVATHEEELARLGVDHQEVQERIRNESVAALGALREELTQARTEALDALRLEHADQVKQLNAEHQAELTPLQQRVRELEEQIPRLEDQHRLAIEHLEAAQVVALRDQEQRLNHEHDQAINALQLTHADALRQLEERLTQRQVAALEALQTDHEKALRLRDEAHELAIQGKDHDIAELRLEHDEANRELLANHALALRQLTERLVQEKTNALDAVQHNHEEALRNQEQRLGEDKDHALELLQTQQVDALRIQGEGHAIALEELRREYAVAIDAVRNELEETRVQQRAAQEEHEREVSRLTSAFAGERVQYESSNLAIQERLQAAEVRITQHDLLERGQARTEALDALRLEHADQVKQLNAEHQAELTPLQQRVRELEEQIPRLEDQHRLAIEHLEAAQVVALRDQEQRLNHEHDQAINALQLTHADALRQLEERLTQRQVAALEALQTDHEKALRLRDEAHELAIQGKDHDIAELRLEHDEANRELLANHALALRQLTERLVQEKTNALDAVQHNHEEALRNQEQRLGEDKDHALELLQTQQVDALRIQGEGHAIALEELRREYAVAIDAVRNELEETRVQQRAAQEEHEREVSRLTSAFAGERVQYESSNLAIQERLQAAEVRITQHDLLERGQARTEALDALRLEHADQVKQLNAEHQAELTPLQQRVRELEEQIPRLEDQHRLAIEHLEAAQVVALRDQEQRLNHEHDQAINALQLTHADALRQLEERLTQRQVAALEALQTDHEKALRLRDEAHELAIQGKDHDIAELRLEHDEANRELLANHALALRQLTERLVQEKTNALDAVQHNHEEALRNQEQRLGEDKDHALELLQTQQVDALRIQGEGHAIALEELRREYAVAIDAVRNELEETRVQQRAAQEEHEREVSRLTSAFAGERVQYESSNLAIQERLQAAEVRITQHDLLERGQAEELRLTQTALERKVQALEERYKLIVEALLNTDLEPMESIDLDTFDPIERIRSYRAAASQAQANYEHLLAENEDLTRDVRNLQGELAAAHLQHERVHEELSRRLITSTEESDRLQEQEVLLLERIQMQSETIGRLTSENLHLKQKFERAERASSASLEDVREVMAEAEREKQKSDVQLASQKRALEDLTELLADTQNDHRQIEERNGELRGQMKDLERAHKLELEEVDRNILTAVHHAEELLAKNVGLERRLREEQTENVDAHREKDVVMRRQETSLKDLILDLQDYKAINLAALERLQTTARENERLGEETRIITEQLFEAKEQGLLALTHIHDLENRLGIQRTRVKEISAEREAQSTELDELNSQLERLRNPTTAEVGVARDTLE